MEIFYASSSYNGNVCIVATYFEMMCNLQVSLAIVGASFNRLCSIVYHTKPFLRTKKWTIICVIGQWAVGIILSLPDLPFNDSSCDDQLWKAIYKFIIIVIVPSIICLMNNIMIFKYVRSSTNRIQTSLENTKNTAHQRQHLSRRDLHLLRHMIAMFCIIILGWSPIYLYSTIVYDTTFSSIIGPLFILLAILSLLAVIIYHTKPFLRTKRWAIISIATQWVVGIILTIPNILFNESNCDQQLWKRIYKFVMVVIIPSIICLVNNMMIFKFVRSSTNRIQTSLEDAKNNAHQRQHLSRRDLHLLRHMIVMFCIFVAGWSPIYLYAVFAVQFSFSSIIVSMFVILSLLSVLVVISDLFLYNRELRRYFQDKICHHH
ncbi:unnamed protein product [Adineta steineri]|uniref:G-protein coupled receptors family 1 profile domain-containing protein n=1 Tax=Adineta steineri TaxID=433720 RepID=A0A819TSW4_9BILA|nr:unnamed protein product [Adineta steineri]